MSQAYDSGYGYAPGSPGIADADGPLDAASALATGLQDWLQALQFRHSGDGAPFQLAQVYAEWPDDEDELDAYPVASVLLAGDAQRGGQGLAPECLPDTVDGWALFRVGLIRQEIQLDIWCRDRLQRQDVDRVLEGERAPDEDTGSLILQLPRYWGQRARYNWLRSRRWDSAESTRSGEFRSTWFLEGILPEIRATKRPRMDPRLSVLVGLDVDVTAG